MALRASSGAACLCIQSAMIPAPHLAGPDFAAILPFVHGTATAAFLAIVIDAIFGDPPFLWKRIAHPVAAIGHIIALAEKKYNRDAATPEKKRRAGFIFAAVTTLAAGAFGLVCEWLVTGLALATFWRAVIAAIFLAQRGLYLHVAAVAQALHEGGVARARRAVARIVGRNVEKAGEKDIARAAIESLAENFSDAVTAPLFWFLLLGLPGLLMYKSINTADSMIGHKSPRYLEFGGASARLDDLVNWLPARLSALVIFMAHVPRGSAASTRLAAIFREAPQHRSPNAGWPEAAMAHALGIALCGPRIYDGVRCDEPWLNAAGRHVPRACDIDRALRVFKRSCAILAILVAVLALASAG